MLIRPFLESDEDALIALWQECGLTRPWNDPRRDIARKLEEQRDLFLVGTLDGIVVASAMAGYDGHRGWVYYLAVSSSHRSRGYGEQLMHHVEALLHQRGCPKINLMVRSSNEGGIQFYHRLGYATDEVASLGKRLIPDIPEE